MLGSTGGGAQAQSAIHCDRLEDDGTMRDTVLVTPGALWVAPAVTWEAGQDGLTVSLHDCEMLAVGKMAGARLGRTWAERVQLSLPHGGVVGRVEGEGGQAWLLHGTTFPAEAGAFVLGNVSCTGPDGAGQDRTLRRLALRPSELQSAFGVRPDARSGETAGT
jgi:hypothetical protein